MAERKILKYKDGTEVLVPISKIIGGANVEVVRATDTSGDPLDSVTINNISAKTNIDGYAREINVTENIVDGDNFNLRLEENIKLRDGKLTFGGVVTTIDASIDDGCLFLHEVTV